MDALPSPEVEEEAPISGICKGVAPTTFLFFRLDLRKLSPPYSTSVGSGGGGAGGGGGGEEEPPEHIFVPSKVIKREVRQRWVL